MIAKPEEKPSQRFRESSKRILTSWLDLESLAEKNRQLNELLYQELTKLPSAQLVLEKIRPVLKTRRRINLLYATLLASSDVAEVLGWQIFDQARQGLSSLLQASKTLKETSVEHEIIPSGRGFLIILFPKDDKIVGEKNLERIKRGLQSELNQSLEQAFEPAVAEKFEVQVGKASCQISSTMPADVSAVRLEQLIHNSIEEAMEDSAKEAGDLKSTKEDLSRLLQPIYDLQLKKVLAYEAPSYEPGSKTPRASQLLQWGQNYDLKNLPLFVSIEPATVGEPELRKIVKVALDSPGSPLKTSIVFEIAEPSVTINFDYFKLVTQYFKTLNFGIALNNMRSHYAAFETMNELKPDFVKISAFLTSGINEDPVKQELVLALSKLASRIRIPVIAEEISTQSDLETLKKLGIRYGQGTLLGNEKRKMQNVK